MSMEVDQDVPTILTELRMAAPEDIQSYFYTMEDLWERKLWHQLTETLLELYTKKESEGFRMRIFSQFISTFQTKVNQFKLVKLGLSAASQCTDLSDALDFLLNLSKQVKEEGSEEAYIYAQIESARIKLLLNDTAGARKIIDDSFKQLDKIEFIEQEINAAYYRVNADYYKATADFSNYYKNAILYVECIDSNVLSIQEQRERAYDLCISALLGENVYNFGELLSLPICDSLDDTPHAWLKQLIVVMNAGDMPKFESLSANLAQFPVLQNSLSFLRQKICLNALTETVFKRSPSDRTLTFEQIAKETNLVSDEVEHLVMKALSLKLIEGTIDQVAETVTISWVQPRVMTIDQIIDIRQKLGNWNDSVNTLGNWLQTSGKDLWALN